MKKGILMCGVIGIILVSVIIAIILFYFFLYPLKYREIILKNASIYNLEPPLLCSIINAESGFDKNAVSSAGAMGLMQIMPETAQEISVKLGVESYNKNTLFSPETNIRFGCFYLSYLFEIYNNNLTDVLAAYNAGLSNVNSWLANEKYSSNGSITKTPFKETNSYIKKVKDGIKIYKSRV